VSLIVDEHRQLLADRVRVAAFREAIETRVRPGDVALDLGSGTGILGLLACRAGAARVYAVEVSGMIEMAREIWRANGLEDRVVFVRGLSTEVDLPEKADVVVGDQVGRFAFEAGLLEYFDDARRRHLAPGGAMIPWRVDLHLAPVECPAEFARVAFWEGRPEGFDLGPARALAVNTAYPVRLGAGPLLSAPVTVGSVDLTADVARHLTLDGTAVVGRGGTLHGLLGWCTAWLSDAVVMSNSPLAPRPIDRSQVFFPIERPLVLEPGDRVTTRMHVLPAESLVTWTVEVRAGTVAGSGAPRARFTHSTMRGMPIAPEDLRRTRPGSVPALSTRGRARLSVLSLCDGRRSLAEIEREVHRRHPELFRSFGDAAGFVAEVIGGYAV